MSQPRLISSVYKCTGRVDAVVDDTKQQLDDLQHDIEELQDAIVELRGDPDENPQPLTRAARNKHFPKRPNPELQVVRRLRGHFQKIYSLDWHPNSRMLATASQDGNLMIWNGTTGLKVGALNMTSMWVMSCAFSPTGQYVATGGLDNVCTVTKVPDLPYVPNSHPLERTALMHHEGYLSSIKWASDSRLFTSSGDATVAMWDFAQQRVLRTFEEHAADVMSLDVVSGDDPNIFVSGSCDMIANVWDIRAKQACVARFPGHDADINCVRWMPDNTSFVTGSDDSTVRIFEMRCRRQLQCCRSDRILNAVTSLDRSSTGGMIFVSYEDKSAVVWDTAHAEMIQELDAHESRVSCLKVAPDGEALATASWDCEAKIWA